LNVQRQFVHIDTSQQHRLTNLLSTIQRDVPPQPSQSYQRVAPDSDDDSDDGFYLTSSSKASNERAGISCSTAINVESDDDSDDDDDLEEKCEKMSSAVDSGHVSLSSQRMKDTRQECVEHAADQDLAISSSDDDELAEFAASFDMLREASVSGQSRDANAGENVRPGVHGVAGGHGLECADDDEAANLWQRMHGNQGAFELKVEGIDDVTDFGSEFARQPAALPAEATGNLIINMHNSKSKSLYGLWCGCFLNSFNWYLFESLTLEGCPG